MKKILPQRTSGENKATTWPRRCSIAGFLLIVLLIFVAVAAHSADHYISAPNGNDTTGNGSQGNPWATVTYAIGQASATDTINVQTGTYNAEPAWPVNVNKSLTIRSVSGAATTFIDASASGHGAMIINSNGVTIGGDGAGFTIKGGGDATHYEHVIDVQANYSTIEGNTIVGFNGNTAGIYIEDGHGPGHQILSNTFRHVAAGEGWGIFGNDLGGSAVDAALISGNQFYGDDKTWGEGHEGGPGTCIIIKDGSHVTITGNAAYNIKYTWLTFYAAYPRPDVTGRLFEDAQDTTISHITVTNNTVHDCRTAVNFHRARISGQPGGWTDIGNLTIGPDVVIGPGNDFCNNSGSGEGIKIDDPCESAVTPGTYASVLDADNIVIKENTMYGNQDWGVFNGAKDNTVPMSGQGPKTVDAERNWWGNASGPTHASNPRGSGDTVSNNVDFDPWYTNAAKTTLSTQITVAANPNNITVNGAASVLTASATNTNGNAVPDGTVVLFQTDLGTLGSQTASATTTGGNANVNLTPGNTAGIATVRATADGKSAVTSVFINDPGAPLVTSSKTEQTQTGTYTVNASAEAGVTVTKEGVGTPVITVAQYDGNPGTPTGFATGAGYVDVHLDDATGVTQVAIRFCPAVEGTMIQWWNGTAWEVCSNQRYDAATGCAIVTITASTRPSIADLGGLPFAKGVFPGSSGGGSSGANRAPIPNAGPDQTVSVGERVILDGSRSYDPDEDIPKSDVVSAENRPLYVHQERSNLKFQWSFAVKYYLQGTPVLAIPAGSNVPATVENLTTEHGSFTPDEPGQYVLNLTITDDFGASLTDQVTITAAMPMACTHSFPAGWNLISLPLHPVSPSTDVLLQETAGAHPQAFVYEMGYQRTDAFFPTGGYWVYFPDPGFMNLRGRELACDVAIELPQAGWHLIGTPYPIRWKNVGVAVDSVELSIHEAVCQSVIASGCYQYSPETGEYWVSDYLLPWEGYWVRSLRDKVSVVLSLAYAEPGGESERILVEAGGLLPPRPPQFSTSNLAVKAYPTPVRHSTVHFVLEGVANVEQIRVSVYTSSGKRVWSDEAVGTQLDWNAHGEHGERLAWGPYIYTINALIDGRWVLAGRGLIFLAQEN